MRAPRQEPPRSRAVPRLARSEAEHPPVLGQRCVAENPVVPCVGHPRQQQAPLDLLGQERTAERPEACVGCVVPRHAASRVRAPVLRRLCRRSLVGGLLGLPASPGSRDVVHRWPRARAAHAGARHATAESPPSVTRRDSPDGEQGLSSRGAQLPAGRPRARYVRFERRVRWARPRRRRSRPRRSPGRRRSRPPRSPSRSRDGPGRTRPTPSRHPATRSRAREGRRAPAPHA